MKTKKIPWKTLREYALLFLIALGLSFLMNRFVYANAEVPSGSMMPTVMPGDRMIVNRLAYAFSDPKRGDIVMFKFPDDEKQDYLKRIIGLPGETVEIKDGLIYIDGSKMPLYEPYLKDAPQGDYGPFHVPADSYFLLGDNRDGSKDSRDWNKKYVKKAKIVGKAWLRYYPHFGVLGTAEYSEAEDGNGSTRR